MLSVTEAKSLARELARSSELTHSFVLEACAHAAGYRDWNTFQAAASPAVAAAPDDVGRQRVVPILRVFDHQLAREFYVGFLGFAWDWEQRHEPGFPVYAQVSRAGSVLHLSEHHGDATPGAAVMIIVDDVRAYRDDLLAKEHPNARPDVEEQPWGLTMLVHDPFGNRLTFWQRP